MPAGSGGEPAGKAAPIGGIGAARTALGRLNKSKRWRFEIIPFQHIHSKIRGKIASTSHVRKTKMSESIESQSRETRRFAPSAEFAANALAKPEIYQRAKADRLGFWA